MKNGLNTEIESDCKFLIFLFVTRHKVHCINTLCRTQVDKNNVLQGIGAGGITGLQTLFATALKAEPQVYRHIYPVYMAHFFVA